MATVITSGLRANPRAGTPKGTPKGPCQGARSTRRPAGIEGPLPQPSVSKGGGRGSPYLSLLSFFSQLGSLPSSTPQGRGKNSATGTRTRDARVRAEYPNQLDYSGCCSSTRGAGLPALRLARPIPTTGDAKRRARSRRNGSPPESGCPS